MAISTRDLNKLAKTKTGNQYFNGKNLGDSDARSIAEILKVNSSIFWLDLDDNKIGSDGAIALAEMLKANNSLEDLDLSQNQIGPEGATAIAEALKTNKKLKILKLNKNKIGPEGAAAIAEALKSNTTLEQLEIDETDIGDVGAQALAETLSCNSSLKVLHIGDESIEKKGAQALAQSLATNTGLNILKAYSVEFRSKGVQALAQALAKNSTLQELTLGSFPMSSDSAEALAQGIESNSGLTYLSLQDNGLDLSSKQILARAIKTHKTLNKVSLGFKLRGIASAVLPELLEGNDKLAGLELRWNGMRGDDMSTLAQLLSNNRSLVSLDYWLNTDDEATKKTLASAIIDSGNQNICEVEPKISELSSYLWANKKAAGELLEKINENPIGLTLSDFEAMRDRIHAIIKETYYSPRYGNLFARIQQIQGSAKAAGVDIQIPSYLEKLASIHPAQITQSEFDDQLSKDVKAILAQVKAIAKRHKVSVKDMLGHNIKEPLTIEEIERLLSDAERYDVTVGNEDVGRVQNAKSEFANSIIIPHIDYFVVSALRNSLDPNSVDLSQYPNIKRVCGVDYVLGDFSKQAWKLESTPLNFNYLRDPSQGDHMTRLRRALGEVNGTIGQYEGMFKEIEQQIADTYLKIEQSRGLVDERGNYLKEAKRGNEFRTDRMHEYNLRATAMLASANAKNAERAKATVAQSVAYWGRFVPIIGRLSETISDHLGHPNLGNSRALTRANQVSAEIESQASRDIIAYYQGKQVDTDAIEREIAIVQDSIEKMNNNQGLKRLEQDKTKQKAVAEAFVNKLMLNFGQHMSENLLAVCEEHGIAKIDDFFAAFDSDPRLKEAFTNLCFGYADSNDLSVIFAEVAALKGDSPAHKAAHEFLETVLKPNIDSLYMHASKVDLIYQANLTGLGTDLHNARHMIRSEHDMRVKALFGDSFGVDSEMGALTIRGAVDVKNLFDYYMHRHGKTTLTDTKIHDGLVTGNTAPKGVSVLTDTAMAKHKELAKASRGYRQDGPDISDMFLRICGYEYFRPQAPNGVAQGNIMANNPEAPASYQMTNRVIQDFIKKLSFGHIDDYRAKVGTKADEASKLDNLIAQTFMDFFAEVGAIHAADPKLGGKRSDLKAAAKETGTFGFAFDSYERLITKDALGRFDLFLEIYKRNLENQLRDASVGDGQLLREQITAVAEITQQQLNPPVVEPGSEDHRHRARLANHTFENTHWRGVA